LGADTQLNVDPLVLVNFLIDHRARLDGAVMGPGFYLSVQRGRSSIWSGRRRYHQWNE